MKDTDRTRTGVITYVPAFGPELIFEYRESSIVSSPSFENMGNTFVWFSDRLLLRPVRTPGWILSNLAQEFRVSVDEPTVQKVWNSAYYEIHQQKMLFNPQLYKDPKFIPEVHYRKWLEGVVNETVRVVTPLFVGLNDVSRFTHRAVKRLMHRKYVSLNEEVRKLLVGMQQHDVPFGVIANEGPHIKSFFRHISRIDLEYSPFPIEGLERIPIVNAMDDGYAKPLPEIFKRAVTIGRQQVAPRSSVLIPDLQQDQWFIGSDPKVDIVPNGQSFNLKSVLVTSGLREPVSDINSLDIGSVHNLQSFRISDVSEIYRVLFGDEKAAYYKTNDLFHITSSELLEFDNLDSSPSRTAGLSSNEILQRHNTFVPGFESKDSITPSIPSVSKSTVGFDSDHNLRPLD